MSEPTSRHPHPHADDGSWENLAENLFGIDFKQPGPAEDLAAEDLSLDDELLGPPAARDTTDIADSEAAAAEMSGSADRADVLPWQAEKSADRDFEEDLGFEEQLGFEEELSFEEDLGFEQPKAVRETDEEEDVRLIEGAARAPAPAASAPQTLFDDDELDDEFDADLDLSEEAEDAEPAEAAAPEDDTYWDALKDWEWDDAEEPAAPAARQGRRPPPAAVTPRYVPRAVVEPEEPAWAEGRDEFIDNPDFAAGLLDDAPPAPPARSSSAAPAEPASRPEGRPASPRRRETREEQPADDEGPRRRRRRRRRGRPEPAEAGETAEAASSQFEREEPEGMDVEDTDVEQEFEPAAGFEESEGDEFGLGLEVEEAPPARDTDRGPRRGRRRRPRRREAPSAEPAERASERIEPAAGEPAWEDAAEPEGEDIDEASPAARWEDIPTWEEAVALLVNPGRSGTREPSRSDGDRGPRPSRPRSDGGRRGRRRR